MNTRAYGAELLGTFLFFAIGLSSVQAVGALGGAAPLLVVVPFAFGSACSPRSSRSVTSRVATSTRPSPWPW